MRTQSRLRPLLFALFTFGSLLPMVFAEDQNAYTKHLSHVANHFDRAHLTIADHLNYFVLKNTPYYLGGPLGEGSSGDFDQDPLFRFDAFDCTTLVETAIALGSTSNYQNFSRFLLNIRYEAGIPSYFTRNHFIEIDWVPHNAWLIEDVTENLAHKLGFLSPKNISGTIDKSAWFRAKTVNDLVRPDLDLNSKATFLAQWLQSIPNFPVESVEIPTLSREMLSKPELSRLLWSNVGTNTYILNIVRPMRTPLTDYIVTHQALLLVSLTDGAIVYHASTGDKKVVSLPLSAFVTLMSSRSRFEGFQILEVRQNSFRKTP